MTNRKEELENIIDNHDCHLSPDSSCRCVHLRVELAVLNKKLKVVPYRYHSIHSGKFGAISQDEHNLWNEVREDRV